MITNTKPCAKHWTFIRLKTKGKDTVKSWIIEISGNIFVNNLQLSRAAIQAFLKQFAKQRYERKIIKHASKM